MTGETHVGQLLKRRPGPVLAEARAEAHRPDVGLRYLKQPKRPHDSLLVFAQEAEDRGRRGFAVANGWYPLDQRF